MATLSRGPRIEYTYNKTVLFLAYRDKTSSSTSIQDALCADDLTMVSESRQELQHMVNAVNSACKRWGMTISSTKTKMLTVGGQQANSQLPIKEESFF